MQTWQDIEGWLEPGEGELLRKYARKVPKNGTILEIGTLNGRSTVAMAEAAKKSVRIISVDPFYFKQTDEHRQTSSFASFLRTIKAHNSSIISIPARIEDVHDAFADLEIDFSFIDGLHTLQNFLYDFAVAALYSKKGGLIAVHDYYPDRSFFPGLAIGLETLLKEGLAEVVDESGTLRVLTPNKEKIEAVFTMRRPGFVDKRFSFC